MGILNVTPDSFSGDGLLAGPAATRSSPRRSRRPGAMVEEGADLLDIGGESTRPGHAAVDEADGDRAGRARSSRRARRAARLPISVDTTKPAVAAAALDAGADLRQRHLGRRRGRRRSLGLAAASAACRSS